MTSKGQGPPTFLGSDPTKGAGSGWTMSDFGTTHTTEGFWANNHLHNGIKDGLTRINGSQFTGYGRSSQYLRNTNVGQTQL